MSLPLTTQRLRVRAIEDRDAEPLLELLNDSDWLRLIGDRGVHDLAQARAYLNERKLGYGGNPHYGLYVVERLSDGAWLGTNSFFQRPHLEDPDIGFAFLPIGRGQGYAYESTVALLEHLRSELPLARVLGTTIAENSHSIRLLEKLGMRFLREERRPDETVPSLLYVLEF